MTFDEGIICLKKYIDQYGTSKVPYTYQTDDKIALGKWVSRQRELYHDGRLSVDKIVKLKELNFVWKVDHKAAQQDNADNSFEEFYNHLKEYKATYGHCDVPQAYQCKDGYRLGAVVNKKRMRPERMSEEQIQMIEFSDVLFELT